MSYFVKIERDANKNLIKKTCSKCLKMLEVEHFVKTKHTALGFSDMCRSCLNVYWKEVYQEGLEKYYEKVWMGKALIWDNTPIWVDKKGLIGRAFF